MTTGKKVLGLGDQVVDEYVNLDVMYPGGNALNFAAFAEKLGYEAAFLGIFGDDKEAEHVKKSVDELGIDRSHSRTEHGENGCAKVNILDGDRVFVGSNEGGVAGRIPLHLTQDDLDYIKTFNLIHMGIWGNADHLLPVLSELDVPISYDFSDEFTNETVESAIGYVQYGFFSLSGMPANQVEVLLRHLYSPSSKVLIATRGSQSTIAYDGQKIQILEPRVVKAIDTMAAGDSFLTAFLLSYQIEGKEMNESMRDGQAFAEKAIQLNGSFGFGTSIS